MEPMKTLVDFNFSDTHGFLAEDPDVRLPRKFSEWEALGKSVADRLLDHTLRDAVHLLPELDIEELQDQKERNMAFTLLSFICNGYVWQEGDNGVSKLIFEIFQRLPRQVAVPIYKLSKILGTQPAMGHSAFALTNWKLIDPKGPFIAENLTTFCTFPGGRQMEWFVVVTVEIEKNAVPGIKAAWSASVAAADGNIASVVNNLDIMTDTINQMRTTLKKMYVGLESGIFFDVIRPWLSGWGGEGNPLPDGLIYDGVSEEPLKVNGGSAAQSSTLGCFDAVLGVQHEKDRREFLDLMLDYMPKDHRELILYLKEKSTLKRFVESSSCTDLTSAYNACVQMLTDFRSDHIQLVTKYIVIPSRRQARHRNFEGVADKGTGGTELIPFLKSLRDTTKLTSSM